ncbi:hypothetical protein Tco_0155911 [Tanacetum coccineum]
MGDFGIKYQQKDKNKAKADKTKHDTRKEQEIEAEGGNCISPNPIRLKVFLEELLTRLTLLGATLAIPHNIIGCETWHAIQQLRFDGLMLVMIERLRLKIGERLKALDPSPLPYIKRHAHTEMEGENLA